MNETDLAYIAGLADGEGSFCIMCSIDNRNGKRLYSPSISISNTNANVLNWVMDILGVGYMNCYKDKYYTVNFRGSNVAKVSKLLLPYLRIKWHHAQLMLQFPFGKSGVKCSEKDMLVRELILEKIRDLNTYK